MVDIRSSPACDQSLHDSGSRTRPQPAATQQSDASKDELRCRVRRAAGSRYGIFWIVRLRGHAPRVAGSTVAETGDRLFM